MPNDKFFASTQFNGGHENNLLAAYDGKVDVAVDDSSGLGDFKDGFTSGTFRKEVDKGSVDPNKLVEVWRSPLIPNGPLVVSNKIGQEWQGKLADFFMKLPQTDAKCFSAIEGGDFKGYVPVKAEFYNAVIDIRKNAIGG
jgi:phosphonate transport system substrate-binding protein